MGLIETPSGGEPAEQTAPPQTAVRLRLYVARSTPNSVRAEHNLSVVLDAFHDGRLPPELEIIDVFSQPKRALTDGVVVTPTLVGLAGDKRVVLMGDLADLTHLRSVLEHLLA